MVRRLIDREIAAFRSRISDCGRRQGRCGAKSSPGSARRSRRIRVQRSLAAAERRDPHLPAIILAGRDAVCAIDRLMLERERAANTAKERAKAEGEADAKAEFFTMIAVVLAFFALVALMVWWMGARGIVRPIAAPVSCLRALSEGDTTSARPGEGQKERAQRTRG